MKPLARRSTMDLSPRAKLMAYLVLGFWTLIVLFPLYWLVVTSFKLPIQLDAGPRDIAFWIISQRILPPVAVVIPIYVLFQNLGLLDTRTALVITYTAANLPIVVWLMRDYFSTIPLDLDEAAAIDGAGPFRVFRSI